MNHQASGSADIVGAGNALVVTALMVCCLRSALSGRPENGSGLMISRAGPLSHELQLGEPNGE